MTTITIDRAVVEYTLHLLNKMAAEIGSYDTDEADDVRVFYAVIAALRAALAQKHDPVAHSGWVLREVLFDNGEPIGHREPQHSPAALAQQGEPVVRGAAYVDALRWTIKACGAVQRDDGVWFGDDAAARLARVLSEGIATPQQAEPAWKPPACATCHGVGYDSSGQRCEACQP